MGEAVAEEYRSSLSDLNYNSKPHITMLTMLAEENKIHAPLIVNTIGEHIKKVPPEFKLPSLYLVDSIMKNVGGQYIALFSKQIVSLFSTVFEKVEETTRSALFKLRQTWNEVLASEILYGLDCKVNTIDPAWPIIAQAPTVKTVPSVKTGPVSILKTGSVAKVGPTKKTVIVTPGSPKNPIHVNPKFLGPPQNQQVAPQPVMGPKPSMLKKNFEALKGEREIAEIKRKQEEMLRLIEEKKMQLKALEMKKMQMSGQQVLQKEETPAVTLPPPTVQKRFYNQRDPRLRKNLEQIQAYVGSVKSAEKQAPVTLQSVVIVPNSKPPAEVTLDSNSVVKPPGTDQQIAPAGESKSEHGDKKNGSLDKKSQRKSPDGKNKQLESKTNHEHSTKNKSPSKKRTISPQKGAGNTNSSKKVCHTGAKHKRTMNESVVETGDGTHPAKKGRHETAKGKSKHPSQENLPGVNNQNDSEEVYRGNQRHPPESPLFGNVDKDYRQLARNASSSKTKNWNQPEHFQHPSGHMPSNDPRIRVDLPLGQNMSQPYKHEARHSPLMQFEESNSNQFPHKSLPDLETKPEFDRNRIRLPPPGCPMKTFMLDGKNRAVYFVNDRALAFMDNNEPRELTFIGPPRNVFISGIPQPLVLGFNGQRQEFETEGKRNIIHFGTPSREVYINNFPYEATFGGPPFIALLEDKKEHCVRIEGPPPQVVVGETPAYELYEKLHQIQRISPQPPGPEPGLGGKPPEPVMGDVDMRFKPIHAPPPSSILNDSRRDIDWRHVPITDAPPVQMYGQSYTSTVHGPGVPNQWEESIKNQAPGPGAPPLPHDPRWRPNMRGPPPLYNVERPPFGQPVHMNPASQMPRPASWEMQQSSLPPPPRPPSLNPMSVPRHQVSTVVQGPNPGMTAPQWNPLPPPPMFPTLGSDTQNPVAPSGPAPAEPPVSLPSAPVNVGAIFEKLVAAGIIPKTVEAPPPPPPAVEVMEFEEESDGKDSPEPELDLHELLKPENLRIFRVSVISALYRGSQCATCGMRFRETQSEHYRRHLDWHFRRNHKEKGGAKKPCSRRWYYEIKDWIEFKEIEDVEERAPSYFELQAGGDASKNDEKEEVVSVPASQCETEKCSVCGEKFQLFWVEDEEEWHLKNAVTHDREAYHPMCYEDHKKAEELAQKEAEAAEKARIEEEERRKIEEAAALEQKAKEEAEALEQKIKEEVKYLEDIKLKEEEAQKETEVKMEEGAEGESLEEGKVKKKEESGEVEDVKIKEEKISPVKQTRLEDESSDVDSDDAFEDEFRPPTPDPRFNVLLPVERGKELSALCTIM